MKKGISVTDISIFNGEPTISDKKLAALLGYSSVSNFRKLIRKHIPELSRHGDVHVQGTQPEIFSSTTEENIKGRGRPGTEYRLNRKQALTICAKAETPNAAEVLFVVVTVFDQWLSGTLPQAPNNNLPERTPAPIDARARLFAEAAEIRLTFGPREAQNYLLENGLPDPRIQRMPRNEAAYACLRNLLNAPVAGRRLVDHMRQVFHEGRRREALAVLRSLKINFTGDGFDIPNVLPKEIADWFENTRWERPFEYLRSLSDALPFQKRGGRYSHSYTHIPASFLDEA